MLRFPLSQKTGPCQGESGPLGKRLSWGLISSRGRWNEAFLESASCHVAGGRPVGGDPRLGLGWRLRGLRKQNQVPPRDWGVSTRLGPEKVAAHERVREEEEEKVPEWQREPGPGRRAAKRLPPGKGK